MQVRHVGSWCCETVTTGKIALLGHEDLDQVTLSKERTLPEQLGVEPGPAVQAQEPTLVKPHKEFLQGIFIELWVTGPEITEANGVRRSGDVGFGRRQQAPGGRMLGEEQVHRPSRQYRVRLQIEQ